MKSTLTHGKVTLAPLDYTGEDIPHRGGIETIERYGPRGELHYFAAVEGIDPALMVAWAPTQPTTLGRE